MVAPAIRLPEGQKHIVQWRFRYAEDGFTTEEFTNLEELTKFWHRHPDTVLEKRSVTVSDWITVE